MGGVPDDAASDSLPPPIPVVQPQQQRDGEGRDVLLKDTVAAVQALYRYVWRSRLRSLLARSVLASSTDSRILRSDGFTGQSWRMRPPALPQQPRRRLPICVYGICAGIRWASSLRSPEAQLADCSRGRRAATSTSTSSSNSSVLPIQSTACRRRYHRGTGTGRRRTSAARSRVHGHEAARPVTAAEQAPLDTAAARSTP